MLGKVGENKNCLLRWVWVHPEMASMAPSWTSALVAIGSFQPIPWASHCAFYTFNYGLLFGLQSFLFSSLTWSFVWTLILSIFFTCVVLFGLWSFLFSSFVPLSSVFPFIYFFIYLSLSWFPHIIHVKSSQTICLSCQLATKVLATFELLSYKGAFECWSKFSQGTWISQRIYTNGALCLDAHAICSYFVQNLILILDLALCY